MGSVAPDWHVSWGNCELCELLDCPANPKRRTDSVGTLVADAYDQRVVRDGPWLNGHPFKLGSIGVEAACITLLNNVQVVLQ